MLRIILTAVAMVGIQVLAHRYLWRRLAVDTALSPKGRKRVGWGLFAIGSLALVTLLASRTSSAIGQTLGWPMFIWLAVLFLAITMFALVDIVRLVRAALRRMQSRGPSEPDEPARRAFLGRIIGGGVAAGAVTLSAVGTAETLKTPGIKEVAITLQKLDPALDGFTIAQLTDVHVGNTIGRAFVEDVVARTNASKPDMIVITGDLIDGSVADLRNEVAPLANLRAPHGVFFVTGNHEYYSGADEWIEHVRSLGIRVLRNEHVAIGGARGFDLAGVDDHDAGGWPGHGPDLAKALVGRDESRELIVLAHQPKQVHESAKYGAGLQLSGHTHGGQIWPWHYLAMAQQGGLLAGHSMHRDTQLYISRGTGHWGPPVRLFAPAEITKVTLHSKGLS